MTPRTKTDDTAERLDQVMRQLQEAIDALQAVINEKRNGDTEHAEGDHDGTE